MHRLIKELPLKSLVVILRPFLAKDSVRGARDRIGSHDHHSLNRTGTPSGAESGLLKDTNPIRDTF